MMSKSLSEKALFMINQYQNFSAGTAVCSIPYFNNRRTALRGSLPAQVGKGSPREIMEELQTVAAYQKINVKAIDSQTLKKVLVDNAIGIDCSGLAYHVLNEECIHKNKGSLKNLIFFTNATTLFRRFRAKTQPAKNIGVITLTHEKNSRIIPLGSVEPGDIITMIGEADVGERNHVLVVHEVACKDGVPITISYTHSIAWPTDGEYGHGVRQGLIHIIDASKPLIEQHWIERERTGDDNYTLARARRSKTDLRRFKWL